MSDSGDLSVGYVAPEFSAPLVTSNGEVTDTSLSSLLADGPVLLSFYMNDFTPDCIEEWCSFRDYDWFASGDHVQVVGISKSRPKTHRRFIDHLGLQFPLYTDENLEVADSFGVKYRTFKVVNRAKRSCFLIDQDRTIRYVWVGNHPIDPTIDTPPLSEIHEAIVDTFGSEPETFGF
ncbi:redoxin domain-containing protein [Haladaptatus cibarius]|uniref:redoxin domain-containing protein n=1 Tax=Haladaptatus cibarius TaxID=453847 RepID=UPI0006784430|nr:redoxin domain-containing protein [Haladaptatus cibarius]